MNQIWCSLEGGGHKVPATSTTSQFALKIQKKFLAEKYEEGQRKNCHWGLGSQKLKLGAPGLFKKDVSTFCPPSPYQTRVNKQTKKRLCFLPDLKAVIIHSAQNL